MRNEARQPFRPDNTTLLRWADECEHDGWTICKPYDTAEYRKWLNGEPNGGELSRMAPKGGETT